MTGVVTFDIETNNLLNKETIDYCASPYKLKNTFKMHFIVVEEHDSGEIIAFYDGPTYKLDGRSHKETVNGRVYTLENYSPIKYTHKTLSEFKGYVNSGKIKAVVGHNIINFDLLVCKLFYGIDYSVCPDSWGDNEVEIIDTLVLSKTLNPDRFGGHSLDNLSSKNSTSKIKFRDHLPQDIKFKDPAADMLYYCIFDVLSNTGVYKNLMKEKAGWDWEDAISLEKSVAEIITRQEHRGFKFDKELAEANIEELDTLMAERKVKVEPLLPPKPATKGFMKEYTPPVRQFLQSGEPSSYILKFAEKIGGTVELVDEKYVLLFDGVQHQLPLKQEPLVTQQVATINDTTHIKDWLVSAFGWQPSEYKEKDLSVNSKKEKLSKQKFEEAVDRYVEQTLNCAFCADRCEFLQTTPKKLKAKLMSYKGGRSVKVLTNPSFTKGQEKELCSHLEALSLKFPYARDVVEYLTYKHRRNSILGGGLDWDDEGDAQKGYLAYVREDGRIPTPADTCGAATSRFKHKVVCNVPRVSSLYGDKMRGLFGVDEGFIQIGYDFDSLEAREEAHYCYRYDQTKEYCESLLLDKPLDVHTQMSKKISSIIARDFGRTPAKSVKYAATYGATEGKIAKTIGEDLAVGAMVFEAFWLAAAPLKTLKDNLAKYWEKVGGKKFILGIDGRKVPTRSAHAILNSLFQSAGVICAKRAMVIHDQLLREEGYYVDFFKDDWKNKSFCQQLVAYHDESQLEVSASLVKFKLFNTEDEAKEWKQTTEQQKGIQLSDVGHSQKGYYVGYCHAGELAVKAVDLAGKYYNLNVSLTAGYMLGSDWASCH